MDVTKLQLCLPEDKLLQLKKELTNLIIGKNVFKNDLASLVGLLQFATKAIHPGHPFLRQLYAAQHIGTLPTHQICLNQHAIADILW